MPWFLAHLWREAKKARKLGRRRWWNGENTGNKSFQCNDIIHSWLLIIAAMMMTTTMMTAFPFCLWHDLRHCSENAEDYKTLRMRMKMNLKILQRGTRNNSHVVWRVSSTLNHTPCTPPPSSPHSQEIFHLHKIPE